jgi:pyridinium-3,5-bisthiocarboxylic acid mononucleotide nickel chelatase
MKLAYLDGSSGISGDMFLGALLDAGVDAERLRAELAKLGLEDYEFKLGRAMRCGIAGNRVEIAVSGAQPHRHLHHIEEVITKTALSDAVKSKALAAFRKIAEAEGKLHDKPPEKIHFHEVGAVDAILDIVGTCLGFEMLGVEEFICSPLNLGSGRVQAAHGSLPVPAPATAELLKGIPVYSSDVAGELVTPTGAALVATLASSFGPMPRMTIDRIGYGAGANDPPGHPNIARLFVGERAAENTGGQETISIIEANVDDMSPQIFGYFSEKALAAGALDVTCAPIQMKKNRPGFLITVLARPEQTDALANLMFAETTTIGVRIHEARRKVLERKFVDVETPFGRVQVKISILNGKVLNTAPEYDECERVAREKSVPIKEVIMAAQFAFRKKFQAG